MRFFSRAEKLARVALQPGGLKYLASRVIRRASITLLDRIAIYRQRLDAIVAEELGQYTNLDVVAIGDVDHCAVRERVGRRLSAAEADADGTFEFREIQVRLNPGSTLLVYAKTGLLSTWKTLEPDLDLLLADRHKVVLVFAQPDFYQLSFASHTYILSLLLSALPRKKFVCDFRSYLAPEISFWSTLRRGIISASSESANARGSHGSYGDDIPVAFSALVLSIRKAARGIEENLYS